MLARRVGAFGMGGMRRRSGRLMLSGCLGGLLLMRLRGLRVSRFLRLVLSRSLLLVGLLGGRLRLSAPGLLGLLLMRLGGGLSVRLFLSMGVRLSLLATAFGGRRRLPLNLGLTRCVSGGLL